MLAYAAYFSAYLLDNINKKTKKAIERIILFGSVAREEATAKSDVDIFIELKAKNKPIEREIKNTLELFYQSREALLFKAKGIDNKINLKLGKLREWQDLYSSIASTGIILDGPYEAKELPMGVKHQVLIFWENIPKNRGAFLNKLYGFKSKEKRYLGLLSKFNGQKIGKSSILVPIQHKKELLEHLQKYKVKARMMEVFV